MTVPLGSYWETDHTQHMVKELHERKWEIDSLCYPIRLAYHYWLLTKDISAFDADWHETMKLVVQTFKEQQRKQGLGPYSFTRDCDRPTDSQINNGWGAPVKPVGLIVSSFRPSDDATQYGFLIPSNMFAVVVLGYLEEIETEIYHNQELAKAAKELKDEVYQAIEAIGKTFTEEFGMVYAYETDGFGMYNLMDDANVPSLLAMPYLGDVEINDPIYQNTRRFVWSKDNPISSKERQEKVLAGLTSVMIWYGR